MRELRTYEMVCHIKRDRLKELEGLFRACGLQIKGHKMTKKGQEMVCTVDAYGPPECHEQVMEKLLDESEVIRFKY